ncbi:hypothetical protein DERP_011779 [Dermatophagoides pteronyssinus]|uniref:Uncharacterized protein n=1 Tax=Dermatophagoides pteronyssinus TaxID=6956 RepID=A0ABQ8JRZ2_DERPT|nr:hypothetical protein DERP_011779 [Dermatophagoides pteronyssinus]
MAKLNNINTKIMVTAIMSGEYTIVKSMIKETMGHVFGKAGKANTNDSDKIWENCAIIIKWNTSQGPLLP